MQVRLVQAQLHITCADTSTFGCEGFLIHIDHQLLRADGYMVKSVLHLLDSVFPSQAPFLIQGEFKDVEGVRIYLALKGTQKLSSYITRWEITENLMEICPNELK